MNVPRLASFVIGSLAALVIVAIAVWAFGFLGPGGFTEGKAIFATLQALEVHNRQSNIAAPKLFLTYPETGPIIVVATSDHEIPYAWIAGTVNACDGELCMVPGKAHIVIGCEKVLLLKAEVAFAPSILAFLMKSCRPITKP